MAEKNRKEEAEKKKALEEEKKKNSLQGADLLNWFAEFGNNETKKEKDFFDSFENNEDDFFA